LKINKVPSINIQSSIFNYYMAHIDKELLMTKARDIRLLALDVDGVLTDGSIVYTSQGEQVQSFHVHDGLGLKLLGMAGIHVAILSSRSSRALAVRAEELGIKLVYQGLPDAGLAVVVADAAQSMEDYADYVTQLPGGRGAVREVCELILKAQNRRSEFLNHYLNPNP
jgi:3-deoxy-D-manno-octulosonate 8-phosphate phosphatase (KDO 8-P phosphatase)